MRYKAVPKRLLEETGRLIRFSLFLRHEVGLKENLPAKDLRVLLNALKESKKG